MVYTYIHICHICMHIHIFKYVYIHIYMYQQELVWNWARTTAPHTQSIQRLPTPTNIDTRTRQINQAWYCLWTTPSNDTLKTLRALLECTRARTHMVAYANAAKMMWVYQATLFWIFFGIRSLWPLFLACFAECDVREFLFSVGLWRRNPTKNRNATMMSSQKQTYFAL